MTWQFLRACLNLRYAKFSRKIFFLWKRSVIFKILVSFLFPFSTGMEQKENRFPKMVCHQTRNLHGLVTAPKPTKTTKTLLADGQPMTDHGLDCDIQKHLQQKTPFFSIVYWFWFNLLASDFPAAFLFLPISWFYLISSPLEIYFVSL